MKILIMTNGEYGRLEWYTGKEKDFDQLICVDGGAGGARKLGIIPDLLAGDMDSIAEDDLKYMEQQGVQITRFSSQKDHTDTQISLQLADQLGADEITVWGGIGSRLDHTLSNLYSAAYFALRGKVVRFDSPDLAIYLVKDVLRLSGEVGNTVSVLALGDRAEGITLEGFQYPLTDIKVDSMWQIGVSNVVKSKPQVVRVTSGILAVFYYRE